VHISRTLKSLSNTRWSCRADSTKALRENYSAIREALQRFAGDAEEKDDAKREAAALCRKLDKLETAIMASVWDTVLGRFKATSDSLQKRDMDLNTAQQLLESLRAFVASLRNTFEKFEKEVVKGVTQSYHHETQRVRKRKTFADETTENEVILNGSQRFKVETFNMIIDRLLSCLAKRIDGYRDLNGLYGVLFDADTDSDDVRKRADALASTYPDDLDKAAFGDELIQFKLFVLSYILLSQAYSLHSGCS